MRELPVPTHIKEEVIKRVSNKRLAEEAFRYIKLVEKEDGTLWVKEELPSTDNHALMFMVLACVNYTQRLLRGEELD
ncbi:hypothetical protein Thal_0402 [Thermocrinis albus DSM 14484]|uniref:Transposase n=1 Tax=Thermocrinis albus (strain DSM 14484 / JCM 11386 / HI 11/12) TaxID=638303 RepID=D3SPF0_THEAH|nr:hypothetical protein [Thermocrinis albus]ADC89037.1 hypothetical protein Thal_0402 [Thermocrinis albus DSM 14484]